MPSDVDLDVDNLITPASILENSIGFQTLPPGYSQNTQTFPTGYTLTGRMNINLFDVLITLPDGTMKALTSANASAVGKVGTNGSNVNVTYGTERRRAVRP